MSVSFSSIMSMPIVITNKENRILDYNIFSDLFFENISEVEYFTEIDRDDFLTISLKKVDIHVLFDENISESLFKKIIDCSDDEIFISNAEGIAVYCNEKFVENYGIPKEKLLGKHVNYIVENNYVDVILFDKVVESKKTITYKQKTVDGRIMLNTSSPILNKKGDIIYVVEKCRDITENEIMYKELNHAKSRLMKEEKIVEKNSREKNKFIGFKSEKIREVSSKARRFSDKDINILITGDSGTGKTSLAKYIHKISCRSRKPFVNINCATIPENLIESELFGYTKGAFTGASNTGKKGLIEEAEGGTLFLDEIGEVPINLQAKLLELVQEKQFIAVGGTKKQTANVRIIAATNCDLERLVSEGKFRKDLYYRLNMVQLKMPSLSERPEDIELFVNHFMSYFNTKYNTNVSISEKVKEQLINYSWPGNIRELEYLIEYLLINSKNDSIKINDLPKNILNENKKAENLDFKIEIEEGSDYKEIMNNAEEYLVKKFYKKYNSSYKLAKALKVSQSTANRLIKKHCR